jgi:diguanylate cyclase (GGDEF)-like protein/PAS domain S-box-containing protein
MPLISIRYLIPLLIVLFTGGLAIYTVQRDWSTAEAVVRGEAVARMTNRMAYLQNTFDQYLSKSNNNLVSQDLAILIGESEPQFAVLADESSTVMSATNKQWIGQGLFETGGSNWKSLLNEPIQIIVDRVKSQHGGEVHLLDEGHHLLGVYPIFLGNGSNKFGSNRTGVLVIQRDLSQDLSRARHMVARNTMEMVSLLVAMSVVIGILVHFFLSSRLNKLVSSADRFAKGDFEVRTNLRGKDEVAKLGRAFDRMAAQVADSHRNLELRVEERTIALADTVSNLQSEINQRLQIEQTLFNEKERIQVTLRSISDAVITTDVNGLIDFLNPVAEELAGIPLHTALGRPFLAVFQLFEENGLNPRPDPVQRCLVERKVIEIANLLLVHSKDNQTRSLDISASPINDRNGRLMGVVLICRDVTEMQRITHQLSYQASHDSMTGLFNRREFEHRLQRLLNTAKDDESNALLYLDLDQFKIVNDTCGHFAGDELLRQVSALLNQKIRKMDTLARLGGDEFGVLLEHCSPEQALQVANQIRVAIKEFCFVWEDRRFRIGASIGLVPIIPKVDTLESVFRTADSACYAAKELGRNRVHMFQHGDLELAQRHGTMQWIPKIQEALANNHFILFFQPIIPICSVNTIHYEVLLRLIDNNGELMPPSVFIPVAEQYNQMQAIDRWVIQHAFTALNDPLIVPETICLSINISGQSLSDPYFLGYVEQQIESRKIRMDRICFEITETAAIGNLIHAQRFIAALKQQGCRFALDDFGSGLSSFAYLKTLPIDFLKIDGAFVKDMMNDPIDYAMVEAIHRIGHVMGIETIAEYVENETTLALLKSIGVNYAQGYCMAYPRPLVSKH